MQSAILGRVPKQRKDSSGAKVRSALSSVMLLFCSANALQLDKKHVGSLETVNLKFFQNYTVR